MGYMDQYKQKAKDKSLQDITPEFVQFKEAGEFRVGRFIGTIDVESQQTGGHYKQYIFDTDEGRIKFHMGANADKEIGSVMKTGGIYFIEFQGKEDIGKGQTVNKWKVLLVEDTGMVEPGEEKALF